MKSTNSLPRTLNDQQLYSLLKKGDPHSLAPIYARYQRLLFWHGKQMLEDDFVVETLVQDVFLKLWLHRDAIESPGHILGFLRFVLKRECLSYYRSPRNKFAKLINSLERYENYQDYLAGYDPAHDKEYLHQQEVEQKRLDEVKKVLNVLDSKRKHLLELCLEYGFQYKPIAEAMGSSVTQISNEVNNAIQDLRKIIKGSGFEPPKEKVSAQEQPRDKISPQQLEILKRRFEQKASFSVIAQELQLSEKEVHREFLCAYQYLQHQNNSVIPL